MIYSCSVIHREPARHIWRLLPVATHHGRSQRRASTRRLRIRGELVAGLHRSASSTQACVPTERSKCVGHAFYFGHTDHTAPGFVELLNDMRLGNLGQEAKLQIRRLDRRVAYNDGIEPTEMYVARHDVHCRLRPRCSCHALATPLVRKSTRPIVIV